MTNTKTLYGYFQPDRIGHVYYAPLDVGSKVKCAVFVFTNRKQYKRLAVTGNELNIADMQMFNVPFNQFEENPISD